ncbi:MAG TPA: HlyD family secretion protein [Rhizomicrobium sp.]|jgi:multidrug resistance efflux pump|nr:HlyD family secretion protein [Rhizomicrobium sp.]
MSAADTDHPEASPGWRPPALRWHIVIVIVALAITAILSVLAAFDLPPFGWNVEATDNAYVRGRTTVIAPQVSGYVVAVPVTDYAQVKAGQILVRIDDSTYRARVEQARANLAAATAALANNRQSYAASVASLSGQQAGLVRAQADIKRVDDLVKDGSVSVRERDQTLAALLQAQSAAEVARQNIRTVEVGRGGLEAQVAAARAALNAAQIDLEHTVIYAPESGQIGEVVVRLGQYVTNGTQLMSLVPADRWVIANYKEGQTAHMAQGQPASFRVDALAGARFTGHVERLSPAAGSEFSVLKADNATGNFVKVPQRIGVRIAIDPGQKLAERLRPGMSVTTRIDTSGGP